MAALEHIARDLLSSATSTGVNITWEGGVVIAVVSISLLVMALDLVGPDLIFAGMASLFMALRIITIQQGSAGFSNNGVLTVVALYTVAEGVAQTGGLERLMSNVMGNSSRHRGNSFWAIVRLFVPVAFTAAFLNNTPIVALLIPVLISWSKRNGISPKKMLIPLSYFVIFGGTCTLIGTSTNLVVAGLQNQRYTELGQPENASFSIFDITPFGIPYAITGFLYVVLTARWLLPGDSSNKQQSLFLVLRIQSNSSLHGKSVREAGLKGMEGLFLVSVFRNGEFTHAVEPTFQLEIGDSLYFHGSLNKATKLCKDLGLEFLTASDESRESCIMEDMDEIEANQGGEEASNKKMLQACVKKGSSLVGKTLAASGLGSEFGVDVVAVTRDNEQQPGKLSDVVLADNDVLILSAEREFDAAQPKFKALFKGVQVLPWTVADKEYLTSMYLSGKSAVVGKTLHEAGLMGVHGLRVKAIGRQGGEKINDPGQTTELQNGDTLWFVGNLDGIMFLLKSSGLVPAQDKQVAKLGVNILERQLVQVSIAAQSSIIGKTVRQVKFRRRFDAVVIGINRKGDTLPEDVRDIVLLAGDVLLLDTGSKFRQLHKGDPAFNLVNELPDTSPLKTSRMWVALALATAMVTVQIVGGILNNDLVNFFPLAVLTCGAMLITQCMTSDQARKAIDWRIYTTIAFAFAVSAALEETTVAQGIANGFEKLSEAIGGQTAPLVCMYIVTGLLSEILTNNAAAALMYPIAASLGDSLGINPSDMSAAVMLGASASFIMPYGYQCNLMVFSAGNYSSREFIRFGTPLQVVQILAVIVIFLFKSQIWVVVAVSAVVFVGFIAGACVWDVVQHRKKKRDESALLKAAQQDSEVSRSIAMVPP